MRLIVGFALLALTTVTAQAFDRNVTAALGKCHNYLWDVPQFTSLPNAAISVWPASVNNGVVKVYWVVDWTEPTVKAAGQCEVADGSVIGFENYLEQEKSE